MRRAILLAVGTAFTVGPMALLAGPAASETKAPAASYKTPRNVFGQPDLSGFWSNASLTPLTRPASAGGRAVYTEDEVKKLEAQVVAEVDEGNADTDPDAPAEAPKVASANVRPEFAAAGGDVGGSHAELKANSSQLSAQTKVFTAEQKNACSIEAMRNGGECEACQ